MHNPVHAARDVGVILPGRQVLQQVLAAFFRLLYTSIHASLLRLGLFCKRKEIHQCADVTKRKQKRRFSYYTPWVPVVVSTSWGWARFVLYPSELRRFPTGFFLEVGLPGHKTASRRWSLDYADAWNTFNQDWRTAMAFELRKRETDGSLTKFLDDFEEPWFKKKYPACHETLFRASMPDGTFRQTGLLMAWRSPEGLTVKVQDGELQVAWQFTDQTFEGAMGKVEKAIQAGAMPNRSTKARPGRQKIKKP